MSMKPKTDQIASTYATRAETIHDFGMRDAKGRAIGARVALYTITYALVLDGTRSYWNYEPGLHFVAYIIATRDGSDFGASQGRQHFTNEADREAYVTKRLASMRKRYAAKVSA